MEGTIDLDFDEYDDFDTTSDHGVQLNHTSEKPCDEESCNRIRLKFTSRPISIESRLRRSSSNSPVREHQSRISPRKPYDLISERRVLGARRFGIEPHPVELSVTEDELFDLYKSMGIDAHDPNIRFHSVLVHGISGLTAFQVHKIFAEFSPTAVDMIDDQSCNVIWNERFTVGKMILEMTKPLKRVRGHRETEEGEVDGNSSDEEDGEMKEEQGDDVIININKEANDTISKVQSTAKDYVEVDIDKVCVPPGKWRVLTKHVAHDQFIILRLSLRKDLRKGRIGLPRVSRVEAEESTDKDGFTYKWTNKKDRIRPGLNIFDAKGNELEWDYEHDTRFYTEEKEGESPLLKESDKDKSAEPNVVTESVLGKRRIKSRGRGAKKARNLDYLLSGEGSMVADLVESTEEVKKRKDSNCEAYGSFDENAESDVSDDLDPNPTPQPWNYKKVQPHFKTSDVAFRMEKTRKT